MFYFCFSFQECTDNVKDKCVTTLDGYFVETIFCTVFGILWFLWAKKRVLRLQSLGENAWLRRRTTTGAAALDRQQLNNKNLHRYHIIETV